MFLKIAKFLLFVYHGIFASQNAACRFTPTCSAYAIEAIEKYGILKGLLKASRRILSCHPFSARPIYDPA